MDAFLRTMEYPCTKDDLLREAEREGLTGRALALLRDLQDRAFHGALDVRRLVEQVGQVQCWPHPR
ncbi:MAG: DUF2795 domain-containing protein [Actinobacteria bacterium]|nr:DUF2795 domain-containing protein [Actinomycetota bacterium]